MSEELYTKVAAYRQAMSLAKAMLVRGIITEKEYGEIDTMMAQRYDLSFGTIFR
jgi:energy-coupling factor transporter transmembrane protein EcfT